MSDSQDKSNDKGKGPQRPDEGKSLHFYSSTITASISPAAN